MVAKEPRTVLPLADGIREHWDLPALNGLEPLRGGYHNVLLRSRDVVVRIEERDPESVRWEHELLNWLRPVVPEAPAPIAARDGSTFLVTEDRVVSLLPFVDGEPHGGLAAAELLARVHVRGSTWPQARPRPGRPAFADLDWERNDWWDWSRIDERPAELVRAFERARSWVESGPELVVTPIHDDPAQQNVLWRDGRIVALLDWEWSRLEWPALELAAAAWSFAVDDPRSFVSAYLDAGGPGEPEAFAEGTRIVVLANALYALTRGGKNRDWVEYLLARLRELG